jgi:hypothetical protein
MKTIKMRTILALFLLLNVVLSHAIDIESVDSPQVIDYLLFLPRPEAPRIIDDYVVFTASSSLRQVGIAFADEGFAKIHWFKQLMVRREPQEINHNEKNPNLYKDSGIVFYVHQFPEDKTEIDYRLIINGLWTTDPANSNNRLDHITGLTWSTIILPKREIVPYPLKGPPGSLSFVFKGPPGETVSVAGSFNGWDPFMYELKEGPTGNYSINIPLPAGTYQYVFFHRGQRYLDPYNGRRSFTREGEVASEIVIQ